MTLKSFPNNDEEMAATASTSAPPSTDGSMASRDLSDAFPIPFFDGGRKEVVMHTDEGKMVAELPGDMFSNTNVNIKVKDSPMTEIGNQVKIVADAVTINNFPNPNSPAIQNFREKIECTGNVRVIRPPPITAPSPSKSVSTRTFLRRHFKAIMILLTVATVVCAATLITLRFVGDKTPSFIPVTDDEPDTTPTTRPPVPQHYFFTKGQWGGRAAPQEVPIDEPVQLVIVKHTKTKSCADLTSCFQSMQTLQSLDVGQGYPDIQYNFVIGGDGNMYEGRGWGVKNEQRNNSIDISFMGDFDTDEPNEWMVGAGKTLLLRGLFNGHLDLSRTKVVCHNQTEVTTNSGANLCREVMKWEYYTNETFFDPETTT